MGSTKTEIRVVPASDGLWTNILSQAKTLFPFMLGIYIPTLLALVALVLVNLQTGIPIAYFTRDPAAEFQAPMYVGLFSNLGVLLWCATAAICLFGGVVLIKVVDQREVSLFLLCSGLTTAVLLFDDFFLLHEEVFPDHLHIPQKLVYFGYGALILAYLLRFRRMILSTEYLLLVVAMGFFAMSVFVDFGIKAEDFHLRFIADDFLGRHLLEDGFKLLGIVSWSAYFIRSCVRLCQPGPVDGSRADQLERCA